MRNFWIISLEGNHNTMVKIGIIGSGYIGETIGRGFMSMGREVVFYDIAPKPLPNFTRNLESLIPDLDFTFICVPTPTTGGSIDLKHIREVTEKIGKALVSRKAYHLVVIKSTVVPGTTEHVVFPILEKYKSVGRDVGICMNPEFMTQSSMKWTEDRQFAREFFSEDRIVIGEYDKKSGDTLEELYRPLGKPIIRVDLKTAEMIKYASNCMLATKISYWNEIFLLCRKLGIDSQKVADVASMDSRIGKYGTVHGKAFEGACLPKDLQAFISFAEKHSPVRLLQAVAEINETMKKEFGSRK